MIEKIRKVQERIVPSTVVSFGDDLYGRNSHMGIVKIPAEEILIVLNSVCVGDWWNFTVIFEGIIVQGLACNENELIKIFES